MSISVMDAMITSAKEIGMDGWGDIAVSSIILFASFQFVQLLKNANSLSTPEQSSNDYGDYLFQKRSDDSQKASPFDIKRIMKLLTDVNGKSEDSDIVDRRLKKLVDFGYNLYEFMTSHGSILETATGSKKENDSSLLRSKDDSVTGQAGNGFANLISLAKNGVRYVTSLEKLYKMSQKSFN